MAGRTNVQPLTELQQQFRDIVEPLLEEITIDNEPLDSLDSFRLQEVLSERDIDNILCLKDMYGEDMDLEEKADTVFDLLTDILKAKSKASSLDKYIKQLIEDCVVFELKSKKRKELTADFQRSFNGLVTKEEVTDTKSKIEETEEYKAVEANRKQASSNRRKVNKKRKDTAKIQRTVDALQDISDVISDSKTELGSPDLLELMAKAAAFIEHAGKIQQRELNDSAKVNEEQDEAQPQSVTT